MTEPPTIPDVISLDCVPNHPLTIVYVLGGTPSTTETRIVCEGLVLGTVAKGTKPPFRWQDVERVSTNKKQKVAHITEREDERTIRLLSQLPPSMRNKDEYAKTPFPHGTSTVEELTLIGAEPFRTVMNCYHHWFGTVPPIQRFERELKHVQVDAMTDADLKRWEESLQRHWADAHTALMRRLRSSRR